MTLPVKQYQFVSRELVPDLAGRFKLSDFAQTTDDMVLSRLIIPVTQVDQVLIQLKALDTGAIDPGGTTQRDAQEIPNGERWRIYSFYNTGSAGTITCSGIWLKDPDGTSIPLYNFTAAQLTNNGSDANLSPWIPEGWTIQWYIAAYNAGDTMRLRMLYEREYLF
jgi:hypothetical protein